ncbi:methyl-accepting chemotaxis protein [Pontivivens nitratireducens]|uniref:methyl-accepting chemotaxis protein n=1 Tax=Pontivivens nitratireducens TaxID=2758038 RepID=UPI00163B54B9|nr:methyl-accepting chemotaxis protein [Pontibrevibacter nitratireducens]
MKNTIALRFIASFILTGLGLMGIILFVWSSMNEVRSQVIRSSDRSDSLMHLHDAQSAFANADRASTLDLRRENLDLRSYANEQFAHVVEHLGMMSEIVSIETDVTDQLSALRTEVVAFNALYDDAVAVQGEIDAIGLELQAAFSTLDPLLSRINASDQVVIGDGRFDMLAEVSAAHDALWKLMQNPRFPHDTALMRTMADELSAMLAPMPRLRALAAEDLRNRIDPFVTVLEAMQDALGRLSALDENARALEEQRINSSSPAIYRDFSGIVEELNTIRAWADAQAVNTAMTTRNTVVLIAIISFVVLMLMTLFNIISLLRPLNQFLRAVRNIAQNKAAGQMPGGRNDEFGQMATAVTLIDQRGVAARRIREALDRSDMMLLVAHSVSDVLYVSKQLEDLARAHDTDTQYDNPLAWLVSLDNDLARKVANGVEATVAVHIADRHYDAVIRPIAEHNTRAGFVIQLVDQTAARTLQHDIGHLVGRVIAGDFTTRIADNADGGELNEIGQDVNRMCESFERGFASVATTIAAVAHGDLTHRMDGQHDGIFHLLQRDVNRSIATLGEVVGDITLTGEALAIHSGEVAEEADQLSRQTEMQASALRQCSATVREMARAIAMTSERGRELRALSTTTASGAVEAADIAEAARASMTGIESAASRMRDIVAVINAISFQTKLLALNAAVEAARAGHAGSGFAVVASEVRHLADRAARSAQDISALISSSIEHVENGAIQVSETGEKLATIAQSVNDMNRAIIAISTMSTEQSRSVEEVTVAISAMDDSTQHQTALAEGGAKRARSLQDSAQRLRKLIAQFQLTPVEVETPPIAATVTPRS